LRRTGRAPGEEIGSAVFHILGEALSDDHRGHRDRGRRRRDRDRRRRK
jgi:hypothetical protein